MNTTAKKIRRHVFVFTPEEKKVAACILAALILGLATKHFRETHPVLTPKLTPKQQYAAERAAKAAAARAHSARGQREAAVARATPTLTPSPEDDDE